MPVAQHIDEEVMIMQLRPFCLGAALLFMAGSGFAQDTPVVDVGVGYSFLRINEGEGLNMPAGWLASIAGRTTNWLSVVGEIAGNYKSESGETFSVHTFQGGIRVLARQNPNVRPYGQFLLGGANASGGGGSDTEFSIEPGGGVDFPFGGQTAARVGIGFPMVVVEGDTLNTFRFHVGFVF
jgi:hypothetical protein